MDENANITNDPDAFVVAHYAAKQPRGNELWARIIDQMFLDIERYLAFINEARS